MAEDTKPVTLSDKMLSRKFLMVCLAHLVNFYFAFTGQLPARDAMQNAMYLTLIYVGGESLVDTGGSFLGGGKLDKLLAIIMGAAGKTGADEGQDGSK